MTRAKFFLPLFWGLIGVSACRFHDDDFYAQNRDLIRILNDQDQKGSGKFLLRGQDGYLFYLEDVRAAVVKWHLVGRNIEYIVRLSKELQSRGVNLLVVPVPSKVETYPEKLIHRNEADLCPAKRRFFQALADSGVAYLDLRQDFFQAKTTARLYARTDTHWDEEAICLAAHRIAARLHLGKTGDRTWSLHDTMVTNYMGDLAQKFLPAPDRVADTVRLHRVFENSGNPFAEPDSAEVVLFGDSFLTQYRSLSAHLGAHLSRELGMPVKTLYSLQKFVEAPKKILEIARDFPNTHEIVWVFTSRSLMDTLLAGD